MRVLNGPAGDVLPGTRRDAVELFHRETLAYSIYLVIAYAVLCYGV